MTAQFYWLIMQSAEVCLFSILSGVLTKEKISAKEEGQSVNKFLVERLSIGFLSDAIACNMVDFLGNLSISAALFGMPYHPKSLQ